MKSNDLTQLLEEMAVCPSGHEKEWFDVHFEAIFSTEFIVAIRQTKNYKPVLDFLNRLTDSSEETLSSQNKVIQLGRYLYYDFLITALNETIYKDPNNAEAYLQRGYLRNLQGHAQQADEDFSQSLAIDPTYIQAYIHRGVFRLNQGDPLGAEDDYNQAIAIDPNFALSYTNRGVSRQQRGDLKGAEKDYNQAIAIDSKLFIAYLNRAALRQEQGDMQGAEEDFSQALTIDPNNALAYTNRGVLRQVRGDLKGAEKDYNQAIAIDSKLFITYLNRAALRQEQGDMQGAEEDFNQAITIDPNNANAYFTRAVFRMKQGDAQGAKQDYSHVIAIDSQNTNAYNNRGGLRYEQGDKKGAEEDFSQAIAIDPSNARSYYNRGVLRLEQKDVLGAEEDFSKASVIDPIDAISNYNLGIVRKLQGNAQRAEESYSQAIIINPHFAQAYINRGVLRSNKGDVNAAEKDYNKAIAIEPTLALAYINRGVLRLNKGDVNSAEKDYSQAIVIEPNLALAYFNRGLLRRDNQDEEGAEKDFSQSIVIDPNFALAYLFRGLLRTDLGYWLEAEKDLNLAAEASAQELLPYQFLDLSNQLATYFDNLNKTRETMQYSQYAHEALTLIRKGFSTTQHQQLSDISAPLYARIIRCKLDSQIKDLPNAFSYCSLAKGQIFAVNGLQNNQALLNLPRDTQEILAAFQSQQNEIYRIQNELLRPQLLQFEPINKNVRNVDAVSAQGNNEDIIEKLLDARLKLYVCWQQLIDQHPRLSNFAPPKPMDVEEVQKTAFEQGVTLVEYYRHDRDWIAFVFTPESFRYVKLLNIEDANAIFARIDNWIGYRQTDIGRGSWREQETLGLMYSSFIKPLQLPKDQPVILAPFGELHKVPLHLAQQPDGCFLFETYELNFAPNLMVYCRGKKKRDQISINSVLCAAYPAEGDFYLENVIPEAEAVSNALKKRGKEVTELFPMANCREFKKFIDLKHPAIVHVGCHGMFDPSMPQMSSLWFMDGYLNVADITLNMDLSRTALVTLGACEAARSKVTEGGRLEGLTQAFLYTGAQTVVASQWVVHDEMTHHLFKAFYELVENTGSPSLALRQAIQKVRTEHKEWNHPYYWGSYQVFTYTA